MITKTKPKGPQTVEELQSKLSEQDENMHVLQANLKTLQGIVGNERKQHLALMAGDTTSEDVKNARIGNFMKAVAKSGHGNAMSDEEKEMLYATPSGRMMSKADLGTPLNNSDVTGSYVVPEEFNREIIAVAQGQSELIGQTRVSAMGSHTKQVPVKNAGLAFTYVSTDGGDLAEANPTFTQETLTDYTYACYIGVTEALLEDDAVELGQYFREQAGEAYATTFESEFLAGSGSPVTGLMNDTGTVSVAMGTGSTGFADLEISDLVAMESALSEVKGALRNAKWYMSPYTWNIVRGLTDAMGNNLIAPWLQKASATPLGYGTIQSYEMPESAASAASTPFIGLGNPRNLIYGDRVAMETRFYDQTQYAVTNTEVFFRFRFRGAFLIPTPGYFAVLSTAAE